MSLRRARSAPRLLYGYTLRLWHWLARWTVAAGALCLFVAIALVERPRSALRRRRGAKPRLLWGPSAILNNKYWSESMRSAGYESRTCIDLDSAITTREDWDACRDEFLGGRFSQWTRSYAMFAWALRHADVFLFYFDGGYLRGTPLDWQEFRLLRLAGKRLVFSPYGGDIAVVGHLGVLEEPLLADYPQLGDYKGMLERRVLHSLRWADVSTLTLQPGFQPWFNAVWANQLAIDTSLWDAKAHDSQHDGRNGPVSVVHAPNHREVKGTAHLERAIQSLQEEGLQVELRVLEGVPNDQVRRVVLDSDIVADQFVLGWGLFAVEGMAAGKPVLSNLDPISDVFQETEDLKECPIVNTNPERLTEDLRRLVTSPELRAELRRADLAYVRRYHSYEAVAEGWSAIVEFAWRGTPLPARFRPAQPAGERPALRDAPPREISGTTARS